MYLGSLGVCVVRDVDSLEVWNLLDGETADLSALAAPFVTGEISRLIGSEDDSYRCGVAAVAQFDLCPCWAGTPLPGFCLVSAVEQLGSDCDIALAFRNDAVGVSNHPERLGVLGRCGYVDLGSGVIGARVRQPSK